MTKRLIAFFAAMALMFGMIPASAEGIAVESMGSQIGENGIAYPQLTGMKDETIQAKINGDIVMAAGVPSLLMTLVTLDQQQPQLQMNYEVCMLSDEVFSVILSTKGRQPGKRDGHIWTALTYDLSSGERMTLDQLFEDPEQALSYMETIAEKTLSEELNGYMEYSDLLPLPADCFTLDESGITFWYPQEQFSLFSGYSGAVQFWYEELEGMLKEPHTEEMTDQQMCSAIKESVAAGMLPRIPAKMGQSMLEVTEQFRLLRTPDEFPGGRYYVLEDPQFRQVLVLSDSLYADYSASVVEGIQLRRGGLYGLKIGQTVQERWREVLGQPEKNVAFTENMAYDYNLPVGSYDVYHYGENELRLHADENGILSAVQLCK